MRKLIRKIHQAWRRCNDLPPLPEIDVNVMPGIMFEWDHERPLMMNEYLYWTTHALPIGWSIICRPYVTDAAEKSLTFDPWENQGLWD